MEISSPLHLVSASSSSSKKEADSESPVPNVDEKDKDKLVQSSHNKLVTVNIELVSKAPG